MAGIHEIIEAAEETKPRPRLVEDARTQIGKDVARFEQLVAEHRMRLDRIEMLLDKESMWMAIEPAKIIASPSVCGAQRSRSSPVNS